MRAIALPIPALVTLLVLAACSPSDAEIEAIADQRVAAALTAVPTATPTPAPTATPEPTPTPSPTPTPTPSPTPTFTPTPSPTPTATPTRSIGLPDISDVVDRVRESAVEVLAGGSSGAAQGAGVIFDEQGHILTNNHVVENATQVRVQLSDLRQFNAEIVGTDPESDLAVLKIPASAVEGLNVAVLADPGAAELGDWVIAMGSPLGYTQSVTVGVISGLKRRLDTGDVSFSDLIQTDASINHGNSGGPLFSLDGEVVGINTLINRGDDGLAQGLGFAMSTGTAIPVSRQLIENGAVTRARLSVTVTNVTPADDLAVSAGVRVVNVQSGGAADEAGIEEDDVIVALDDGPTPDLTTLLRELLFYAPGDTVDVQVDRAGTELTFTATLDTPQS